MAAIVEGTTITITRGDTGRIGVSITKNDEEYVPVEGDVIRFAAKRPAMTSGGKQYKDLSPLIYVEVPVKSMLLELKPEHTKNLDFGTYVYDMQITFADGTVDTFIKEATLNITPEVD